MRLTLETALTHARGETPHCIMTIPHSANTTLCHKYLFSFIKILSDNWYSDWLWAGQSGDRIPVGRDFLHLSRPALGPTQPPVQWVPGFSRGQKTAGAWRWPLTPSSAKVYKKSTAIHLLSLRAFVAYLRL
jgi:hypothetical protein